MHHKSHQFLDFIKTSAGLKKESRPDISFKPFEHLVCAVHIYSFETGQLVYSNEKARKQGNDALGDLALDQLLDQAAGIGDQAAQKPIEALQAGNDINGDYYVPSLGGDYKVSCARSEINGQEFLVLSLSKTEELKPEIPDYQFEIDALPIGLMVLDDKANIRQTNSFWLTIIKRFSSWGGAVTGANFQDQIGNGIAVLKNGISSLMADESGYFEMELQLENKDDNWFLLRASRIPQVKSGIVITLQDITVRKKVERALEESLSNYRNIYNMTPVMMHSIDASGRMLSVSNYWLEKMGYKRHEVIGKNLRDFLTAGSKKDADIILPIFFEKGSIYDVSYHFITKSGEILETVLSAIEEGKGTKSARSLAVVTDITPLKKAERQLKQQRQELQQAQSIARLGHFEIDFKNARFTSSQVFDDLLEIESDTEKTFDLLEKVAPADEYDSLYRTFMKFFEDRQRVEYIGRAITLKSRSTIWLECLGKPEYGKDGLLRMVGTIQDITRNKTAEIEIQRLSDRLKLAMQGAHIGVWEKDILSGETQYEDTMRQLFELPDDLEDEWEFIRSLVLQEDMESFDKIQSPIGDQELVDTVFRIKKNDQILYFRTMTRIIRNPAGIPDRLIGVVTDITSDKELVNQLESSLKEKDTLVKEVHHRVKNNMQMISSILSLKSLDLTDEQSKSVFDDCTVRIKSMAVVHDQLYRFYNVSEIDISEYLDHLLSGLNALMTGSSEEFKINVSAPKISVNVDTALLVGLIISELVANAFKHGFKDRSEGTVQVAFKQDEKGRCLSVCNDGDPIPEDLLDRKLSSLGLSLVKTFTTQLGGKLGLHPENGIEVTF